MASSQSHARCGPPLGLQPREGHPPISTRCSRADTMHSRLAGSSGTRARGPAPPDASHSWPKTPLLAVQESRFLRNSGEWLPLMSAAPAPVDFSMMQTPQAALLFVAVRDDSGD